MSRSGCGYIGRVLKTSQLDPPQAAAEAVVAELNAAAGGLGAVATAKVRPHP